LLSTLDYVLELNNTRYSARFLINETIKER
jgi:hypothetical protein